MNIFTSSFPKKIILIFFLLFFSLSVFSAFVSVADAQARPCDPFCPPDDSGGGTTDDSGGGTTGTDDDSGGGTVGGGGGTTLTNPLNSSSITEFLSAIIDIVLILAVPIIVFFIIYGGFLYVTAQGDPGKISTATKAVTWAVVGGVIILGAWVLVEVIQGTVESL